jgi:hypothetical protein
VRALYVQDAPTIGMYDLASHELQKSNPNEAAPTGPRREPRVVCGSTTEDASALAKTRRWIRHNSYAAEACDVSRETSRISPCQPLSALEHFPNLANGVAQRSRLALTQDAQPSVLPLPKTRERGRGTVNSVLRIPMCCETGIDCKDPYGAT